MIKGYIAWPPDNNTYMWADFRRTGQPPPGILCEVCGQRMEFDRINPNYKPPRSYYDLSRCYDGDFLISPKLRDLWTASGFVGLAFKEIPKSTRYYVLRCSNILKYIPGPNLHQEEHCGDCKQYKSVWGSEPEGDRFEGVGDAITNGVYVSDIHVGYYPQKGPLLIIGTETWNDMVKEGFKGLKNAQPITTSG